VRITLPGRDTERVLSVPTWPAAAPPTTSRRVFAAAHVAVRAGGGIDWEETLAFRRRLWALGLGVADAMDTAQRGMGLGWSDTQTLIRLSAAEAPDRRLACGAGTDQLPPGSYPLGEITRAYLHQAHLVADSGAQVILMASRALAATARTPGDYATVYGEVLSELPEPVILHWLGPMFDPALAGYWGSGDLDLAGRALLEIIGEHADRVDGVKVSLLDASREVALRRALPPGVRLYTGDDFNYPGLILGDDEGHSDALLGILAAIAPPASAALHALDAGDTAEYLRIMEPTLPLARHIFEAPTYYYKTGIAFLAWLNGHQRDFALLGGLERHRSREHLIRLFELADDAGALTDPGLAVARIREIL
jgi:hypothetical protein